MRETIVHRVFGQSVRYVLDYLRKTQTHIHHFRRDVQLGAQGYFLILRNPKIRHTDDLNARIFRNEKHQTLNESEKREPVTF